MSGHTKGPWDTEGTKSFWSILDVKGRRIGLVDKTGPSAPDDCRLIAAAPELLEALELAADLLNCAEIQSMAKKARLKGFTPVVRKINAAIAKAKGAQS